MIYVTDNMRNSYRVSVNGWSRDYPNREDAFAAATSAAQDDDAAVKVFNPFNNVIWEN